ncbi:MAG: transcriptional repressor LexA [Oligoflexia bacterium]|nr:transcriptional repressor LexA [Oligoflexia bacterium]
MVKNRFKDIPLNRSDLEVEAFISSYLLREGFSPSQHEIARGLGRSRYPIQISIQKLIAHGRVTVLKNGKGLTSVAQVASQVPLPQVPLLGAVAAGRPIEAIERRESIEVPSWMMKPNAYYFVLRVQGESMIEDHIENGDLVLIRQSDSARNGDRVVALINNEATLKRFEKKNGRILLHPANAAMRPIEVGAHQEFRIAGIFSGILRKTDH